MNTQLSSRDLEKLSAYLDGELSQAEAARLENRFEKEPALRAVLDELRQTRMVLRRLPSRKAPRDFTLSRRMLGQQPPMPRAYFAIRSTMVTVSMILVLACITNFLSFGPMMSMAPEPDAMEAQAPKETAGGAAVEGDVVMEAGSADDQVEEMPMQAAEAPATEAPPMDKSVVEFTPEPEADHPALLATETAVPDTSSYTLSSPTLVPGTQRSAVELQQETQGWQTNMNGVDDEADLSTPVQDGEQQAVGETPFGLAAHTEEQQSSQPVSPWLVLEIGLLVLALLLGLAMFIIRQVTIRRWHTRKK